MSEKRLTRKQESRMLFGVAAGIADYLNIDPVIVRLVFVLMTLLHGWGLLIYGVLAIVMPQENSVAAKANPFDEEEIVIKDAS
ncbi:MAG: PspC domain-containing protein [Chloroflexi bacterium]|nr:PspC domain-containing protein [Chloroflexota bacterium]MBP6804521.1 PspC domain-containing protein [Chloroflexota bacterium]MBP7593242.1 PspC domain-containing protein [Chloroflexota bacterium]